MYFILWIIIGCICAAICSNMARSRGRGSGLWAVLGFFLGLLAILILAVMGNTNERLTVSSASRGEEIAKLKQLHDEGVLTEDEFEQEKRQLLARG
ncbi:SHOCT domain-containing protein [Neorhizobium sp. P12A]|uniref:SHOCT domain-containing protein n=1 Tax=Rhizobium/Agrobacterium group TaxID=227290 RepID=UPI0010458FC8|nr:MULTISPECIES: SHOCT domain-containing protein [Rhizobium/Agrobacterium group]KAA0698291.1 SHOCT domain-containing protein [Neorhizobium sp. P12A]TCR92944.1 putative oligomerization/nucleic acid binding protein [Rhizobium sp. BK376]